MNKSNLDIGALLDLKTDESISDELAQRQFEVIKRSYEYLRQPGNNVIYIADEVGLGKTYIGIGISLLLRRRSENPSSQRDLIIVPKANLQSKWKKEIRNFTAHNYCVTDPIKENLGNRIEIYEWLKTIDPSKWINILRTSSFSTLAGPRQHRSELRDHLIEQVFPSDAFSHRIIREAWDRKYFNGQCDVQLRKLVAFLLNVSSPPIQCLIVDEAHIFKYGVNRSLRNILCSRYLGAVEDDEVLQAFPELRDKMKFPLAEKVICLSATPKDRELIEIKNQFDCFTGKHVLQDATTAKDIEGKLNNFLIRGNLNYLIGDKRRSRNQCRFEHRNGNIDKNRDGKPLVLNEDFESLFWQLLQYISLKSLNAKNNAQFQIGMLAGFESYKLDVERRAAKAGEQMEEYDIVADDAQNQSYDYEVVKRLIEAYKAEFDGKLPPHPKQTRMEQELVRQMEKAEKSLLFVRRIASAYELRERLLTHYERKVVYDQQLMRLPRELQNMAPVKSLIDDYLNKHLEDKLPRLFEKLVGRLEIEKYFRNLGEISAEEQLKRLRQAYRLNKEFGRLAKDHIVREIENVSFSLKQAALNDLAASELTFESQKNIGEDIPLEERQHEEPGGGEYFFTSYFTHREGQTYTEKTYRENWFDIELQAFNRRLPFLKFDDTALNEALEKLPVTTARKKQQIFQDRQGLIASFLAKNSEVSIDGIDGDEETTFLTYLLTGPCREQMRDWLRKRARSEVAVILDDLSLLGTILKNIFRNGSGRLVGFIADASGKDFNTVITPTYEIGQAGNIDLNHINYYSCWQSLPSN